MRSWSVSKPSIHSGCRTLDLPNFAGRWGNGLLACYNYCVPETARDTKKCAPQGQFAQTTQLLQNYARQELREPLGNTGRWILSGLIGAICIGIGTAFLVLGLLRMVQTEWPATFEGRWMNLLPYVFGLAFAVLVLGLAVRRINKAPLTKKSPMTKEKR